MLGGCAQNSSPVHQAKTEDITVVLPIAEYAERLTYKAFGEFIKDRFSGFHVGDDIEYQNSSEEIPVKAIGDGAVVQKEKVSGYGGVIVIKHTIKDKSIHALYGHLDLSSTSLQKGDAVKTGEVLANLGNHKSEETDRERKHLHFALYEGDKIRLEGYESSEAKVAAWINPYQFFQDNGITMTKKTRSFEPNREMGGEAFKIQFTIPEGWEVEYIPSIQALNLFTLSGRGTARERSQIFIRYFDASDFLTLGTVKIHETRDLTIGTKPYTARQYDIEKKPEVADFPDQPAWRNKRHVVTDFRDTKGRTRYYVVAANPALPKTIYEAVLASMTVVK